MTYVREMDNGGIKVAIGSAITAALNEADQTFISYVMFDLPEGFSSLFSFLFSAEFPDINQWSGFGRSEEVGETEIDKLAFIPGPAKGAAPPEEAWGLAVATWVQATNTYHFYFYNLKTHELEDFGGGNFAEGLTWQTEPGPNFIQFGLQETESGISLEGRYAAAAIFDKALTAGQIESLAHANSVEAWSTRGGIIGLWIFDQKKGSEQVSDLTGNGADQGEIGQPGETFHHEEEGGLPQLPLREGEEPELEELRVNVRLVGNVTGKIYCEGAIEASSLFKDPDLYLGYCHLATPFQAIPSAHNLDRPKLDPTDTEVILQVFPLSDATKFTGHWLGTIERRPKALIELPDTFIID